MKVPVIPKSPEMDAYMATILEDPSCDHCLHLSGQWFSECVHCDHEAHSQCDRPDKCMHCHLIATQIWAPHRALSGTL